MPEIDAAPRAVRRAPLEGHALPNSERVKAGALPFAARWILRGGADVVQRVGVALGVTPPEAPLRAESAGPRAALWLGPDEWLLIADDEPPQLASALEAALANVPHALVDVSHRQCAIDVTGAGAARLLNSGVPLDLDIAAFPVGMVARTLLLKAEIVLWRREPEHFRLEAARSFAPYVAAVLTASARDQELC